MKELDVVRLKTDFRNISAGVEGTIVLEYDSTAFEVEFVEAEGDTINVLTTPSEILEVVSDN